MLSAKWWPYCSGVIVSRYKINKSLWRLGCIDSPAYSFPQCFINYWYLSSLMNRASVLIFSWTKTMEKIVLLSGRQFKCEYIIMYPWQRAISLWFEVCGGNFVRWLIGPINITELSNGMMSFDNSVKFIDPLFSQIWIWSGLVWWLEKLNLREIKLILVWE